MAKHGAGYFHPSPKPAKLGDFDQADIGNSSNQISTIGERSRFEECVLIGLIGKDPVSGTAEVGKKELKVGIKPIKPIKVIFFINNIKNIKLIRSEQTR